MSDTQNHFSSTLGKLIQGCYGMKKNKKTKTKLAMQVYFERYQLNTRLHSWSRGARTPKGVVGVDYNFSHVIHLPISDILVDGKMI